MNRFPIGPPGRDEMGATVPEIADALGLSIASLRRRLFGQRPFSFDEFYALSVALGVPFVSLFHEAAAA